MEDGQQSAPHRRIRVGVRPRLPAPSLRAAPAPAPARALPSHWRFAATPLLRRVSRSRPACPHCPQGISAPPCFPPGRGPAPPAVCPEVAHLRLCGQPSSPAGPAPALVCSELPTRAPGAPVLKPPALRITPRCLRRPPRRPLRP